MKTSAYKHPPLTAAELKRLQAAWDAGIRGKALRTRFNLCDATIVRYLGEARKKKATATEVN